MTTDNVIGTQIHFTFEVTFKALAKHFDLSIEEIRRMWNEDELEDLLNEKMSPAEIINAFDEDIGGVVVGNGFLGRGER